MTNNEVFLTILSKVMQEDADSISEEYDIYTQIYELINSDLYDKLVSSHYANAPLLLNNLNKTLKFIENYLLCPELFGKKLCLIEGKSPSLSFRLLNHMFSGKIPAKLNNIKTNIPIVVSDNEDFAIELMTYANKRVPVKVDELECLISSAYENGTRVEQLIKYIMVKVPCRLSDICFLFSCSVADSRQLFSFFVNYAVYIFTSSMDEQVAKTIARRNSAVLYTDKLYEKLKESKEMSALPAVNINELDVYLNNRLSICYFGMRECFRQYEAELLAYYHKHIVADNKLSQAITDDIIRLDSNNKKIISLRSVTEERNKSFTKEMGEFRDILNNISNKYSLLEEMTGNIITKCNSFSKTAVDRVLNSLFIYAESEMFEEARNCLSRLSIMKYADLDMAKYYIDYLSGANTKDFSNIKYPENKEDWARAKMLIAVYEPLCELDKEILERCINPVYNNRMRTGKEIYAKSLLKKDSKSHIEYLIKSFSNGYLPAGEDLLREYKNGENVSISYLANSLIPEACVMMADEQIKKDSGRHSIVSRSMMYYKLAAAYEYKPAIGKIVDIIYKERFAQVPLIKDDNYASMLKKNANVLIGLCIFLMDNNYNSMHYSEILGVIYYCLKNYPQAMHRLSGINTPASNYCKGKMYEYGDGISSDLEQALNHYKKAEDFKDSSKCCTRVQEKIEKNKHNTEDRNNYYSAKNNYTTQSRSSSSSSSDFCFITTAVTQALKLGDNCDELNELRAFRDKHINDTEEGRELVLEYYRIAPRIIENIDQLPNSSEEYAFLWNNYIRPSYKEIRSGNWDMAKLIYIDMVKILAERFNISINEYVAKYYNIYAENAKMDYTETGEDVSYQSF